jgi:hypothetical protein
MYLWSDIRNIRYNMDANPTAPGQITRVARRQTVRRACVYGQMPFLQTGLIQEENFSGCSKR